MFAKKKTHDVVCDRVWPTQKKPGKRSGMQPYSLNPKTYSLKPIPKLSPLTPNP